MRAIDEPGHSRNPKVMTKLDAAAICRNANLSAVTDRETAKPYSINVSCQQRNVNGTAQRGFLPRRRRRRKHLAKEIEDFDGCRIA